jgi:hypothetical protein
MAANCRRIAVEEYALEVQARRYIELYEMILAGVRHEHQRRMSAWGKVSYAR